MTTSYAFDDNNEENKEPYIVPFPDFAVTADSVQLTLNEDLTLATILQEFRNYYSLVESEATGERNKRLVRELSEFHRSIFTAQFKLSVGRERMFKDMFVGLQEM